MENAIQTYHAESFDAETIKNSIMPDATQTELALFKQACDHTGLNPFTREIYAVKRSKKVGDEWRQVYSFQISIDGYRLMAERSGLYAGQGAPEWCGLDGKWKDVWTLQTPPYAARVSVYRRGCPVPTVGVAYYDMSVALGKGGVALDQWRKSPAHMLAKAAESNALRRAFPLNYGAVVDGSEADDEQRDVEPVAEVKKPEKPISSLLSALGQDDEPVIVEAPALVEVPHEVLEAERFKTRDGQLYRDLTTEKLSYMINSMTEAIKKDPTASDIIERQAKLEAARTILAWRKEHPNQ